MSMRVAAALVFLAIGLVGCGGGGSEFDPLDFEGQWTVTYECDAEYDGSFTVTVLVNESGTTATGEGNDPVEGDFSFDGTISGNTLTWTRDYLNSSGDGGSQTTRYELTSETTFSKTSSGKNAAGETQWSCTGEGTKE